MDKIMWWVSALLRSQKWLVMIAVGVIMLLLAFGSMTARFWSAARVGPPAPEILLALSGLGILGWGFAGQISDKSKQSMMSLNSGEYLKRQVYRQRGPRIVVIGGGTGLSVLLKGLKEYSDNLTAVVTVTDDGGSSGRIREMGLLPPGDIRRCLVALAKTETLMDQVFEHRFQEGDGIAGHNLGNLLITALTSITGDFQGAIQEVGKVLAVRGRVLPSTTELVTLGATMADGSVVFGETAITGAQRSIQEVFLTPAGCQAVPEALEAIRQADVVIMGPGSLYTSIIPNLLVPEIGAALHGTGAITIYVANIMTQPGETSGYSVTDHLDALTRHIGPGCVDYVVVNNAPIDEERLLRYKMMGAEPVRYSQKKISARGVQMVCASMLGQEDVAWHDPDALAKTIMKIYYQGKGWNRRS